MKRILVPGKRDRKQRVFLGWKVRWTIGSNQMDLDPDGIWYNSAGCWTNYDKARAALREAKLKEPTKGRYRLVRVFRPESRLRRALRLLVNRFTQEDIDEALRVLRETR